jgi:hypothetical protein
MSYALPTGRAPSRGFGPILPVSEQCCHHFTAVLTAIPEKVRPLRAEILRMQLLDHASRKSQNRFRQTLPSKGESMPKDFLIRNAL